MNKEKITQILNEIDPAYIQEAAKLSLEQETSSNLRKPRRLRPALAAACLLLAAVLGSGAFALVSEAREYREAVAFFEENGLSAEGLSRSDVKAVYRDITTHSFTNGKTAEVLQKAVPGWEISQQEPTPEEISSLWDRNVCQNTLSRGDYRYHIDTVEDPDRTTLEKCLLQCFRNSTLAWSAEFTEFYTEGCARIGEETAVWGIALPENSSETHAWLACVDAKGQIRWQKRLEHSFGNESIGAVLDNGDGTWAVLSRGDLTHLCLSCYDAQGKELSFHKTEVGNLGIWGAARLGDGYLIQLGNQMTRDTALLYRMDREGNLTGTDSYEGEDCDYTITDLVEYAGQVYLSAYAVPKQTDGGGRHEIAQILDYIFAKEESAAEITSEELTPVVRDNYTAVLLLCRPEGGAPLTFYSVPGSLGGALAVGDGHLTWDVQSITSTFFSPATSSFTIGGTCSVFRYTFDENGALTGQEDTGETVPYRR